MLAENTRFSALVWMTSCARDEGSPLGIGFQEQIPQKHTDVEFTMNETATIRLLVCSREMHPLAFLDFSGFQRREPHLYGEGRLLAREIRWPNVFSGTRNVRAISAVVRPPIRRNVSAMRPSTASTAWHAVKMSRSTSSSIT